MLKDFLFLFCKKKDSSYTYSDEWLYFMIELLGMEINNIVPIMVETIDMMTIVIIFYSFMRAIYQFLIHHTNRWFNYPKNPTSFNKIRVELWEYLLLALEIFICSDIILSVKEPTIEHLTQLSIIVIIRIVIAHFLQKEISELHDHPDHFRSVKSNLKKNKDKKLLA